MAATPTAATPTAATPTAATPDAPVDAKARAALMGQLETLPPLSGWRAESQTPLPFDTYHPQGLARVGDRWFMTAVEVTEAPDKAKARPPFDRSPGAGVGHLIEFADSGEMKRRITLGEGKVFHPGGIDFDGERLWVPVAEYRPRGRSVIYTVDPGSMKVTEAFRVPDHIGAVAVDRARDRIVTASWGSRQFAAWTRDGRRLDMWTNGSFYVDYQDCRGLGRTGLAVCGGVQRIARPDAPKTTIRFGGLEVIDLSGGGPRWQRSVELFGAGVDPKPMTRNPTWCTFDENSARCVFVPDDQPSVMYRYSASY